MAREYGRALELAYLAAHAQWCLDAQHAAAAYASCSAEAKQLVDRLRRETGRNWYLAHRLDRATSGVILLAADSQVAGALGEQFMSRAVRKTYLAVCRGWPESPGTIEHPLDAPGRPDAKPATTNYRVLATHTWDIAMGRYPQQRYALVAVEPVTGRYRQIRRHFKHVSHHLIGDTSEGRGDHNRLFRQHLRVHRMLLHAWRVAFAHPVTGEPLALEAPPHPPGKAILEVENPDGERSNTAIELEYVSGPAIASVTPSRFGT